MLTLSRRKGESICITLPDGQIITVIVIDIRSDKVRLGVEADPSISVHRSELLESQVELGESGGG